MGKSDTSRRRKKKSSIKQVLILLVVLGFLAGGYYYLMIYSREEGANTNQSTDHLIEYTVLENTDSTKYLTIILYKDNLSINQISETFYKSELLWPYIFIENKEVIVNPLNMGKDVVLRIPRLSDTLLNVSDTVSLRKTKNLADSILNSVTVPI